MQPMVRGRKLFVDLELCYIHFHSSSTQHVRRRCRRVDNKISRKSSQHFVLVVLAGGCSSRLHTIQFQPNCAANAPPAMHKKARSLAICDEKVNA